MNFILSKAKQLLASLKTQELRPATKMRQIIKMQLGILDTEYKGKDVPTLTVRSEYGN